MAKPLQYYIFALFFALLDFWKSFPLFPTFLLEACWHWLQRMETGQIFISFHFRHLLTN
jgi:hypothetical protein